MRDFKIFFFKVGNGHCSYIEFPNGENGLIDVKFSAEGENDNVIEILKNASIGNLDYLFITHPHRDHIGGLTELVDNFTIGTFIYSPVYFEPTPIYQDWETYEHLKEGYHCKEKHEVQYGWSMTIGDDCRVDYLAPVHQLLMSEPDNVNNNGLVLRITCRNHRLIIPGDIESDGWEWIPDKDIKNATLLLASHHGNNSGYNLQKLRIMNPAFVVISAGSKTEYDADTKYRREARKQVYTTRREKVVACIDSSNTLNMVT